ncbi:hypothetical protein FSARC_10968 [Fusarium sarcochroum]|uniref:5'-deoxynucleotidase n=1 Tax=Fusarium sarcochroum TaxID=1208366 RepID=A0A8H4X2G8_9HYPO|nr:hypothetical protein FSARC_10968 [Fusarium sarcochroum]
MERLETALPFLEAIETLKTLKRAGWCNRGIPDPENVGNHMYQMAWLCYLHPEINNEDEVKAVTMCLVHDMGEITAGDITPADGVTPERKHLEEKLGLEYLSCLLTKSNPKLASQLPEIWLEYEKSETRIAKLVHQIDKFECLHQAFIYQKRHKDKDRLQEFRGQRLKISDKWLADQADKILKEWEELQELPASSPIVFVIVENFNFKHISVGDLLREEQNTAGSVFGEFIATSIRHSVIVPPSLTLLLLKDKIQTAQAQGQGVLIDGFPRSISQIVAFEREISTAYSTIFLDCPPNLMIDRIQQRSSLSSREDDNVTTLQKRIETFLATNESIVTHLETNRMVKIGCEGSVEETYTAVENVFNDWGYKQAM